jgi:selenocysteine-specific elongation factor
MKTRCVVVIGHVDHGKTALVRALTGIDTDRLPEEKQRGLSIAPGFAHRTYTAGTIDFIDAPGHADFIHAMVSGATGAHCVLLVISAVEGIQAQTLEHLRIAGLLGMSDGLIAVTKSDLLPLAERTTRLRDIANALSGTAFSNAPLVFCSAQTGDGIADIHDGLHTLLSETNPPIGPLQCLLPIDRVFSLPGLGTIVTGTLLGQDLAVGDTATLHPDGRAVTFRGLQSRGTARDIIRAGERTAANLRGVAVDDVQRGAVLSVGHQVAPSQCFDVLLEILPNASRPLKHMEGVRVMFGTSSEVASVRLFGGGRMAPAGTGFAQLRFKTPVVGYAGQRAILRVLSPPETIGGAVILDPCASPAKSGDTGRTDLLDAVSRGDVADSAQALCLANHGVADVSDIARLSRLSTRTTQVALVDGFEFLDDKTVSAKTIVQTCTAEFLDALRDYHAQHPLHAMAPLNAINPSHRSSVLLRYVQRTLLERGKIRQHDTSIAAQGHDPIALLSADQRARFDNIETAFRENGMAPPAQDSFTQSPIDADIFKLLLDTKRLVALHNVSLKQTLVFHADTLTHAVAGLHITFPAPQVFTTSQARAALSTSRKIIVPILEYFDAQGLTTRTENNRQMAPANSVSPPDPT